MKIDFIFKQGQDGNWSFVLTRAPIWCVVPPQKRCQCLSGNHSSSVKSMLNVRVSLISRALPSLTSENRVHFISVRLWIQPTQNCHLTASSERLLMFPLFGILDLWLFLYWGRFSDFADGWRKFGFPCVQKTANCDCRWLVHFLSKSVWILLFFLTTELREHTLSEESHFTHSLSSSEVAVWVQFPETLSAVETGRLPSLWKTLAKVRVEKSQPV